MPPITKLMHIFDVDHTITKGSTGRHYINMAINLKVLPRSVLLSIPLVYLRYRLGRLSSAQINRDFPLLVGMKRDLLENVAIETFKQRIKPDIFPMALSYIRNLVQNGEEVAIATSSVDIIVKPLTEFLGIKKVISSSIEFIDGYCTGKFINAPAFSQEKKVEVLKFLEDEGIKASDCAFYSDSIYDLPLLEAVGRPVPTNPDYLLTRHARRMGWEILTFA